MRTTVDTFVSEYMTAIEDRNERIKAFNQMASHELRSPIGTLLFAAAALERADVRADPARSEKITTTIKTNAQRLSWLVQNLQRVTRLSSPLDVPNEQNVEVAYDRERSGASAPGNGVVATGADCRRRRAARTVCRSRTARTRVDEPRVQRDQVQRSIEGGFVRRNHVRSERRA